MTQTTAAGSYSETERRRNEKLRGMFDTAYVMIEPFFDPDQGWSGHSLEHLAFRVLRDNFPDFSSEEVRTIIAAAHRIYIERNPTRSAHLRRPQEIRPPGR